MIAAARLTAYRRRIAEAEVDASLVTGVLNMRYLTGFEGVFDESISAACLVTQDSARLYADFRYVESAETAAQSTEWTVHVPKESLYVELSAELTAEGVTSLALESSVPYGRFKYLSERFEGRILVAEHWVEELRQVKEKPEVEAIRRAAALADLAYDHVIAVVHPGMNEVDVAVEIESFMRRNGSEGVAFDSIAASGPNSARPHAQPTMREIRKGDFLKMDFGARVDGYCSDLTRTVVMGKASVRQRQIYEAVLEANEAAIEGLRAGMAGRDVDAIGRNVLAEKGFADYFGHGLGHGVGLAVHEMPSVGRASRDPVKAGSVVTVEPGVYMPGFGGVRIEDLVLVEEGGSRVLSHSPKHLLEL